MSDFQEIDPDIPADFLIRKPIEKIRTRYIWKCRTSLLKDRPIKSELRLETPRVFGLTNDYLMVTNMRQRETIDKFPEHLKQRPKVKEEQQPEPIPLHILRDMHRTGRIQNG
ncbi:hypothetical protein Pla110_32990 [Polystyrenella longa]|uniref:Uncharacterized protein n=1 Tax=Polystyrenella longa TaxID=2528007 RepID=A0A518CQQ1_9PLAN|nr:hypothetical protein [Polystyrenella longa]QDU81557.1 hypothetical protein Pla110_32990 [Polystyrenella longa]